MSNPEKQSMLTLKEHHASLSRTSTKINEILKDNGLSNITYSIHLRGGHVLDINYQSDALLNGSYGRNKSHFNFIFSYLEINNENKGLRYSFMKGTSFKYDENGLSAPDSSIEITPNEIEKTNKYLQHIKSTLLLTNNL